VNDAPGHQTTEPPPSLRSPPGPVATLTAALDGQRRQTLKRPSLDDGSLTSGEHFRAIFDGAPIGLALVSVDSRVLQVNPALSRILGYTAEELRAASLASIARKPFALRNAIQSCLAGERPGFEFERQYLRRDGRPVWIQVTVVLVRTADGTPAHFVVQVLDVDERHAAAERLAASEARFSAMVEHGNDLIVLMDDSGRLLYASPALQTMLGFDPEDRIGRLLQDDVHPEDLDTLIQVVGPTVSTVLGASARVEFRYRHADGSWRWLEATVTNQLSNPAVAGYVINARDVTDRVVALERAAHQAAHDVLTGLPNRALLEDRMNQAMSTARRRGQQLAALFVDLDHFKAVNDTLGHSAGDQLLTEAAARLQRLTRSSDTVTRLGGDEFVVTGVVADEAAAEALANRVCEAFVRPFDITGRTLSVTVSVGVAVTGDREDHVGLLDEADRALYKAKSLGRNQWVAATPAGVSQRRLESRDRRRA